MLKESPCKISENPSPQVVDETMLPKRDWRTAAQRTPEPVFEDKPYSPSYGMQPSKLKLERSPQTKILLRANAGIKPALAIYDDYEVKATPDTYLDRRAAATRAGPS